MRNIPIIAAAAMIVLAGTVPSSAQDMTAAMAKAHVDPGMEIESRTAGDLNRDGNPDWVIVGRSDDKRMLVVVLADRTKPQRHWARLAPLILDAYPQGAATVTIANGVLKIEDMTGGTTVNAATYRYRLAPGVPPRMRLIGMDVTNYSRTYAHDGFELSWNLLTGDIITRKMLLNTGGGDAAYGRILERKGKRPSPPLYTDTTPDAEELVSEAIAAWK